MRGSVSRRGRSSWRIRIETGRDPMTRKRTCLLETVHGKRSDADKRLAELLVSLDKGTHVAPVKTTIADLFKAWLEGPAHGLSGKTHERYLEMYRRQVSPHLGQCEIQKLRPLHVQRWHETLLQAGGANGRPLSARTVGHCHRLLHKALDRALKAETVSRNVASAVSPPRVDAAEVRILGADQVAAVLTGLHGHWLHDLALMAVTTGMRRGEILALRWQDVDLDGGIVSVAQSLEETRGGLRFKNPKSKHGRRVIALPQAAVEMLRGQWLQQGEIGLQLGIGKPDGHDLVFGKWDRSPRKPDDVSRDWRVYCDRRKLPKVPFHALRHSHASALIAAGSDVVTVSRRLGHASVATTLNVYAHRFEKTDASAAKAIDAMLRSVQKP